MDQSVPVDSIKCLFTIWSLIEVSSVITVLQLSNDVYVILIGGHCCAATVKGICLHLCLYLTSTLPDIHNSVIIENFLLYILYLILLLW